MYIKLALSFLTLAVLLAAHPVKAEHYRRNVEFEWEQVEGAKSYEVELTPMLNEKVGKTQKYKTKEGAWSGPLTPGIYKMRMRANDQRGVPGVWSDEEQFKVGLEPARLIAPKSMEKILAASADKKEIKFSWAPVGGAEKYEFSITSDDGEFTETETTSQPNFSLNLVVAKNYSWKVKAIGSGAESDAQALAQFSLYGQALTPPKLEKPEHGFVRAVAWEPPAFASSYAYSLTRWNPEQKKWEAVALEQAHKTPEVKFSSKWKGGRYKLIVKAHGKLRQPSGKSEVEFNVVEGNRSPAAQEIAITRESIDRFHGWYSVASYLITMVNYIGDNRDLNANLNYSAIGGTGRLGAGYLSNDTAWGFIGIADLGGITIEGAKTFTFASLEASGIYRSRLGDKGEIRQHFGLFYKELPETIGRTTDSITSSNIIATAGPHYGAEYWHALTPKLGFQLNAHLYPSLMTIKTANGQPIKLSLSRQMGVLGSYRLKRDVTGLAGYAYRMDQVTYRAKPGSASVADEGDYNSVKLEGHYLNLFLEWAL